MFWASQCLSNLTSYWLQDIANDCIMKGSSLALKTAVVNIMGGKNMCRLLIVMLFFLSSLLGIKTVFRKKCFQVQCKIYCDILEKFYECESNYLDEELTFQFYNYISWTLISHCSLKN